MKCVLSLLLVLQGCILTAFSQGELLISPFPEEVNWGIGITMADFNRDGRSDLVVLAPGWKNDRKENFGNISVYYGKASGFDPIPDLNLIPALPGYFDGISHCAAGDFNNDGFDDLAVSNPFFGEPQLDRGYVQLFPGSGKGLDPGSSLVRKGVTAFGSYGSNLACADFNGDGIDDLVVGSRFAEMLEGRIYIYLGGKGFSLGRADITLFVENSQALYLEFVTDYNRDGVEDLVCRTNPHWNAGITQYHLFAGGPVLSVRPMRSLETDQFTAQFYLPESRLFIGTKSGLDGLRCTGLLTDDKNVTPLAWGTDGSPVQISGTSFAVLNFSGHSRLRIFEASGEEIRETDSTSLPYSLRTDFRAVIFTLLPERKKFLFLPATSNGRECLYRHPMPE